MVNLVNNYRKIPLKNYIYLALIILFSIAILYYLYLWFVEYNKEQQKNPIMNDVMLIINDNELNTYLIENKDAIIFVSTLNDAEIRKYERKLENLIKNENINNEILYMDLTNKKTNQKQIFNTEFSLPAFLVYSNSQLAEVYEISKDNYNIKKTKEFLEKYEVIRHD